MDVASWSAVAGLLLLVMALSDSVLARLPRRKPARGGKAA